MSKLIKDLGAVSAYAYAVEKGYTGTEDEFASLMYDYTDVIQIASEAKDGAVAANASAQEAKAEAQTASNTANEAASRATSKASEASASVTEAGKATNAAVAAKTAAETAQQRAETAQQASEDAQRKAEIAKNEAQENATIANNKASKASQYATTATNKASEASTSAKNAKTYSEQSQASATTANTKADEASASANAAKVSADNAQQSATNAQTYMNSSSTSASKAQTNAEKTQSDKEAVESAKSDVLSAVDSAQNYANSAQSASQAIQNMDVEATTLEPDSDATVEKTVDAISGAVTLTYGIPKGQVGEKGDKGDTGDSGVYIGTSAPLDTNVNVWIDSDGEPDDVIQIDDTLTQSGQAADAKKTGDKITGLKEELSGDIDDLKSGLTDADYYYHWTINDGYIDVYGKIVNPSSNAEKYTSLIEIPADGKIGVSLHHSKDHTMWFAYALYDSNQEFITRVLLKSGTAKSDNEIITISNDNAKFISFTFRGYNDYYFSVYNPINDKLNENILGTNSIKNSIGEYTGTFSVQSGVSHAWAVDPILVDIKSGETFIVLVKSTAVTGTQIYVQYNDGTNERIYSGNVLTQIFEAKKNIVKLGLYIASQFIVSDGICEIDVIKYGIALSLNSINANYSSIVKSVNHRGFITAPENTLPAYKLSRKMGFTHVETDIVWTSDNVPVLLHDVKINRTARNSDGSEISETVNIADITYEQALAYDFGIWKGQQYAGTKIPTFTEFVLLCKRLGLYPYVELKGGSQEQINGLVAIAKRYDMLENITWISFYTTFLDRVKVKLPNARLGYICDTVTSTKIDEAVALKTSENKVFIDANYKNLTTEVVESCVDADMPLEVYTVDDVDAFTTIDAYVSGYTSSMFIGGKLLLEFYS